MRKEGDEWAEKEGRGADASAMCDNTGDMCTQTLTTTQTSSGVQGTMPLSASPSSPWCAPKMPASTAQPTTTTSSGAMEVSTSLLRNSSLSICWSRGILQLPPASTTWG